MRSALAVLRANQVLGAVLGVTAIVAGCVVMGDMATSLPGIPSALPLVYFAPFGLCAAVGPMWRTTYPTFEQAGVRRPAILRACRAAASCLLALVSVRLIELLSTAPAELVLVTVGCLTGGLLTACVLPRLWWVVPLCLNYAYYASRLTLAGSAAALPVGLAALALASIVFTLLPRRVR